MSRHPLSLRLQARLVALVLALASSAPACAETVHVTIAKLNFDPREITAKVGDVVEWSNQDIVVHSATDRAGSFDKIIKLKETARVTLQKPGKLSYYCRFHPNMTGEIAVAP